MDNTNTKNEDFYLAKAPVKKLLLKFSVPCILAMLVSALYNIIDKTINILENYIKIFFG